MRCIWRDKADRFEVTDEEYVRRLRHNIAVWDRWRWWLLAFYAGGAVGYVGLLIWFVRLLPKLMPLVNPLAAAIGFHLGFIMGLLAWKCFHFIAFALTPHRAERLLLKYYDALTELDRESVASCENEESRV